MASKKKIQKNFTGFYTFPKKAFNTSSWYSHILNGNEMTYLHDIGGMTRHDSTVTYSAPVQPIREYVTKHMEKGTIEQVSKFLGFLGLNQNIQERFLYAGCWHGNDAKKAYQILQSSVHYAFFSDITGSTIVEQAKATYYNYFIHPAVQLVRQAVTNQKLLSYTVHKNGLTIAQAYKKLVRFQLTMEGASTYQIRQTVHSLNDEIVALSIRKLAHPKRFVNFGEWLGSFSYTGRTQLLKIIEKDTKAFISVLQKLKTQGTKVIIVEGNWDNPKTLASIAYGDGTQPVKQFFQTGVYLDIVGLPFYRGLSSLTTKTSYHILAPYFSLKCDYDSLSPNLVNTLIKESQDARANKKTVIMYAHGVPYPNIHDLSERHPVITRDNLLVAKTLRKLIHATQPHEVVYPHFHTARISEKKTNIPLNWNTVSNIHKQNVQLTQNHEAIHEADALFSANVYVPFRRIAIGELMKRKTTRLFGDINTLASIK